MARNDSSFGSCFIQYDEMGYRIHVGSFHGEVLDPLNFERVVQERFGPGSLNNIYLVRKSP